MSAVEVGVEHADLRDLVHRQGVAAGGLPDRLRAWCVVDAEGLSLVFADVGMNPGHTLVRVAVDHGQADGGAVRVDRDVEAVREGSLDNISRHMTPPYGSWLSRL